MSLAAAAWVSFRCRMVRSIRTTSPALIRCSPASVMPRLANTLPVLGSCLRASLFGILHLTPQLFEPLPDPFHLRDVVLNASRKRLPVGTGIGKPREVLHPSVHAY